MLVNCSDAGAKISHYQLTELELESCSAVSNLGHVCSIYVLHLFEYVYQAIDSDLYLCTNNLRALLVAGLQASQRNVRLTRAARD